MSIETASATVYHVRAGHEWARIFLEEGDRGPETDRWGVISIVSGYGNVGQTFGNIGRRPFTDFLAGCDWHYLAGKFWGRETEVFDFDGSVNALRERLQNREVDEAFEESTRAECEQEIADLDYTQSAESFAVQVMRACPQICRHFDLAENSPVRNVPNPSCVQFERDIWKPFREHLRTKS